MHRASARLTVTLAVAVCAALGIGSPAPSAAAPSAAPILTVPGPQTVNEGASLAFTVSATDADGQTVILRATGMPAGASFVDNHNNTGSFSWTPDSFQAGFYVVWFLADDTFGGSDSKSVSIQVLNANTAPVLDPIGDKFVERGGFMSTMITGSDADGDALTMTQTGLPSYGSFMDWGGGLASLELAPPSNEPPGTTSMTVTLSDGLASVSETFSITVYAIGSSNAPVLAPVGNQTVNEGQTAQVDLSATDSDADALTWSVALPGFASFSVTGSSPGSSTARITLAPGYCAAGTYPSSVSVSDGSMTDNEGFTITVNDVNRAPAWAAPSEGYSISMNEGATADLRVQASDPDQECGTAAPALSLTGSMPSALTVTLNPQGGGVGMLHVVAGYDAAGTHTLHVRATDANNPSTEVDVAVTVTVADVNRAPLASAGGPYYGLTGTEIIMSAEGASDPDGDALTYAWTFGDGGSGSGVSLAHLYAAAGHYNVSVTVSDGSLSTTASTTADVTPSYMARAFMDSREIRLFTGKPREGFYLEAIGGTFQLSSLDVSTIKLSAPAEVGAVPYILPLPGSVTVGGDRDHNGVAEMRMEFAKEDLRALFANVNDKSSMTLTLTATLVEGPAVQATLNVDVWPERKKTVAANMKPNPMNPEATLYVSTAYSGVVAVRLYDLRGRLVRTLLESTYLPAGDHEVRFNGRGDDGQTLASGRYFYRVETPLERSSGSLTILK